MSQTTPQRREPHGVTAERYAVRNFTGGVIHGVFFAVSMAFSHPDTVLPAYIGLLSQSKFYIGLLSSILVGGAVLPQLFFSALLDPRPAKKPWLVWGIVARVASWFFLGLSTLLLGQQHPRLILYSLFFWLLIFSVGGALAGVAFTDVMGKAIPPRIRGSFFGLRQLLGSLLAFSSGLAVKRILGNSAIAFPVNYAYLFLLSALALGVATFGFTMIREPIEGELPPRQPLRHYLQTIRDLWRSDLRLRELIVVQNLISLDLVILPFYVTFARERLGLGGESIGTFVMFQVAGAALSNLLWAWMNDRFSSRTLLRATVALEAVVPLAGLALGAFAPSQFAWAFALLGASASARGMAFNTALIDIAPSGRRSTYTGLQGTLTSPTLLFPFLGGLLIPLLGYAAVFLAVATAMILVVGWMAVSPKRAGAVRKT
ncbi:MAG: MFS transporter [Firmicutes bacterium]|nr:MFS transporter [Bacillota bacterium]